MFYLAWYGVVWHGIYAWIHKVVSEWILWLGDLALKTSLVGWESERLVSSGSEDVSRSKRSMQYGSQMYGMVCMVCMHGTYATIIPYMCTVLIYLCICIYARQRRAIKIAIKRWSFWNLFFWKIWIFVLSKFPKNKQTKFRMNICNFGGYFVQ